MTASSEVCAFLVSPFSQAMQYIDDKSRKE